jgi:hypothetical protein
MVEPCWTCGQGHTIESLFSYKRLCLAIVNILQIIINTTIISVVVVIIIIIIMLIQCHSSTYSIYVKFVEHNPKDIRTAATFVIIDL